MLKFPLAIALLVSFSLAEEICNTDNLPTIPANSCVQEGYVCGLGFDVSHESSVMFFHLGADASCSTLLTSRLKTFLYAGSDVYSAAAKFFLIENEYEASPLSLTLAGSLALAASGAREPVSVIYHQVSPVEYGGIRLQSISKVK